MSQNLFDRRKAARNLRECQAEYAFERTHPNHLNNGDESRLTTDGVLNFIGNFTKGFDHGTPGGSTTPIGGEVVQDGKDAYRFMLRALNSRDPFYFARIPLKIGPNDGGRALVNPQAGLAFTLEGPDAQALTIPPAPSIESAEFSGEMAELYWMMILRDEYFSDLQNAGSTGIPEIDESVDPTVAGSLNWSGYSDLRVPKDASGNVTGQLLFRGNAPGVQDGPYISQFLLVGNEVPDPSQYTTSPQRSISDGYIRYGTQEIDQRTWTVLDISSGGFNYVGNWDEFIEIQNGKNPYAQSTPILNQLDTTKRFIRTPRDLGNFVHYDALYQAYLNACLFLLGKAARYDRGNPLIAPEFPERNQVGFGTFGVAHILTLVTEVTTIALKVVWYQKWFVHRRLRPEAAGGIVEATENRGVTRFPINPEIGNAVSSGGNFTNYITTSNGNANPSGSGFLLNQVFPEGSPMHPSYGAGHATVAGACTTILKAFFDEAMPFDTLYEADPGSGGTSLRIYTGPPPTSSTVGYELNKLAYNIAYGRSMAGVHFRSDNDESLKLGEKIAIQLLQEKKPTYNEYGFFNITKFDGETIEI